MTLRTLLAAAETRWLAFLIAVVLGLWAFGAIMGEVLEGETAAFDREVLLALRVPGDIAQPIGPHFVQELMRDCTALGGVAFLYFLTVAVTGYLFLAGRRRNAVTLLIVVVAGQLLSTGFKHLVDRPRPDLVPHGSFVSSASFPSGHSMMSAVVYLTLAVMVARLQTRLSLKIYVMALASFVTVLVGVSRVYLGVHWPTDVLAGWALGAAWAILCWAVVDWFDADGAPRRDRLSGGVRASRPPDARRSVR